MWCPILVLALAVAAVVTMPPVTTAAATSPAAAPSPGGGRLEVFKGGQWEALGQEAGWEAVGST